MFAPELAVCDLKTNLVGRLGVARTTDFRPRDANRYASIDSYYTYSSGASSTEILCRVLAGQVRLVGV